MNTYLQTRTVDYYNKAVITLTGQVIIVHTISETISGARKNNFVFITLHNEIVARGVQTHRTIAP